LRIEGYLGGAAAYCRFSWGSGPQVCGFWPTQYPPVPVPFNDRPSTFGSGGAVRVPGAPPGCPQSETLKKNLYSTPPRPRGCSLTSYPRHETPTTASPVDASIVRGSDRRSARPMTSCSMVLLPARRWGSRFPASGGFHTARPWLFTFRVHVADFTIPTATILPSWSWLRRSGIALVILTVSMFTV